MYHFDWIKRHAERTPDKLALLDAPRSGSGFPAGVGPAASTPVAVSGKWLYRTCAGSQIQL